MHWNPAVGIPLLIIGLVVLALIWLFGQPRKPGQGRRQATPGGDRERVVRREPTLGDAPTPGDDAGTAEAIAAPDAAETEPMQASLLEEPGEAVPSEAEPPAEPHPAPPVADSKIGRRPGDLPMERIITVNVVAPGEERILGADLVVAADKAGLEYGHKGIFHRLVEGKPELGPVFSVANMLKPGSFELSRVSELSTTGVSFFMTLPGPLPALDAWDAMLPTAQRMAELLGGQILDDEHNALGRQRIAHIRDELRAWDRSRQGGKVSFDT